MIVVQLESKKGTEADARQLQAQMRRQGSKRRVVARHLHKAEVGFPVRPLVHVPPDLVCQVPSAFSAIRVL